MTKDERQTLIQQYRDGYDAVAKSLEGFPREALTTRFLPGKWTAAEIVHHLADSENISAQRVRKLLVEDHAVIWGYDQEDFAAKLRYNERDIAPAVESFRSARATTAQLLDGLTDAQWARAGFHTEMGAYDVETWLRIYAAHAHGHAGQIARLRELAAAR